jgi:hypothetical protein
MLTNEQRAELDALGPETVRAKLIQAGPGRGASLGPRAIRFHFVGQKRWRSRNGGGR